MPSSTMREDCSATSKKGGASSSRGFQRVMMFLASLGVITCILQFGEFFKVTDQQGLSTNQVASTTTQQEAAHVVSLDGADDAKAGVRLDGGQRSGRRGGEYRPPSPSFSSAAPNAVAGDDTSRDSPPRKEGTVLMGDERNDDGKDMISWPDEQVLRTISQTNRMQQLRLRWFDHALNSSTSWPGPASNGFQHFILGAALTHQYDEARSCAVDVFLASKRAFETMEYYRLHIGAIAPRRWQAFNVSTVKEIEEVDYSIFCSFRLQNGSVLNVRAVEIPIKGSSGDSNIDGLVSTLRCPISDWLEGELLMSVSQALLRQYYGRKGYQALTLSLDVELIAIPKSPTTSSDYSPEHSSTTLGSSWEVKENGIASFSIPISTRTTGLLTFGPQGDSNRYYTYGATNNTVTRKEEVGRTRDGGKLSPAPVGKVVTCASKLWTKTSSNLIEWVEYHSMIGVDHVFMGINLPYEDDEFLNIAKMLSPYLKTGYVSLSSTYFPWGATGQVYWEQAMLYHTKAISRWMGIYDYDEIPFVFGKEPSPAPSTTGLPNLGSYLLEAERQKIEQLGMKSMADDQTLCGIVLESYHVIQNFSSVSPDASSTSETRERQPDLLGRRFNVRGRISNQIWWKAFVRTRYSFYSHVHLPAGCSLWWSGAGKLTPKNFLRGDDQIKPSGTWEAPRLFSSPWNSTVLHVDPKEAAMFHFSNSFADDRMFPGKYPDVVDFVASEYSSPSWISVMANQLRKSSSSPGND